MVLSSVALGPWVALAVGLVLGLTPSLLTAFATHGTEVRGRMLSAAADFDVLASQLMTQLREIEHLVEDERWADGNSAEVDSALQRGQDLHDQLSAQNIVIQLLFGTSTTALASVAALEAFRVKGATLSDMRSDASLAPMSSGELLHLLRVFNDSARRDMRRPLWLKRVWVREPK